MDIRQPIGWLFLALGALLVLRGVAGEAAAASIKAGLNVNAWWGAVLLVFGLCMLLLARGQRRRGKPAA